jgi:hypothetical protein
VKARENEHSGGSAAARAAHSNASEIRRSVSPAAASERAHELRQFPAL